MSRIEFMSELRALLSGLSVEEREEALQYYNDYFDDAGIDNEQAVIKELGSPTKLAATIKAGLLGANEEESEYRETGYTDTRFESRDMPSRKGEVGKDGYNYNGEKKPWSNGVVKAILIILIIIIGIPVIIPLVASVLVAILSVFVGVGAVFIGLFVAGAALAISGCVMFFVGIAQLFYSVPVALGLIGAGLLLTVVGTLLAVFMGWLLVKLTPPVFRWFVDLCRKPFQKRKVDRQ